MVRRADSAWVLMAVATAVAPSAHSPRWSLTFQGRVMLCAVGDDFVGVHVGRGAGAGLENVHREMRIELAVADLLGGFLDRFGDVPWKEAERGVGGGGVLLYQPEGTDELAWKAQVTDGKIF